MLADTAKIPLKSANTWIHRLIHLAAVRETSLVRKNPQMGRIRIHFCMTGRELLLSDPQLKTLKTQFGGFLKTGLLQDHPFQWGVSIVNHQLWGASYVREPP